MGEWGLFNFAFQEKIKKISLRRNLFPLKEDVYKIYKNPRRGTFFAREGDKKYQCALRALTQLSPPPLESIPQVK